MSTRNIKLTLAYDGTDFCGFQSQAQERTIQNVLEDSLAQLHKHSVRITAASRTDSGAHATGQVVNFFSDHKSIPPSKFKDALNASLPPDIRVINSQCVADSFHARFHAQQRLYYYYLYISPVGLPHYRKYSWRIIKKLNIENLNAMASVLTGTHNFSSFACARDPNKSKERDVYSCCFLARGDFLVFKIAANSFLWKMVRNIIGTILEFELKGKGKEDFTEVLKAKDRKAGGQTAPAHGLFLERIKYG